MDSWGYVYNSPFIVQIEDRIRRIEVGIRSSLTTDEPNVRGCIGYLKELENIPLCILILKKNPKVINTIKKCRRYKKCDLIRRIADRLYSHIRAIYLNMQKDTRNLPQAPATRKSSRKTKQIEALSWSRHHFDVKFVSKEIGKGVFSNRQFQKGDFLLPYEGKLLDEDPELDDETYVFEFKSKGKSFWIDATCEEVNGRYINDSKKSPNCCAKLTQKDGKPGVGFYALRSIEMGEELRYSYGTSSSHYPWRSKCQELKTEVRQTSVLKGTRCRPNNTVPETAYKTSHEAQETSNGPNNIADETASTAYKTSHEVQETSNGPNNIAYETASTAYKTSHEAQETSNGPNNIADETASTAYKTSHEAQETSNGPNNIADETASTAYKTSHEAQETSNGPNNIADETASTAYKTSHEAQETSNGPNNIADETASTAYKTSHEAQETSNGPNNIADETASTAYKTSHEAQETSNGPNNIADETASTAYKTSHEAQETSNGPNNIADETASTAYKTSHEAQETSNGPNNIADETASTAYKTSHEAQETSNGPNNIADETASTAYKTSHEAQETSNGPNNIADETASTAYKTSHEAQETSNGPNNIADETASTAYKTSHEAQETSNGPNNIADETASTAYKTSHEADETRNPPNDYGPKRFLKSNAKQKYEASESDSNISSGADSGSEYIPGSSESDPESDSASKVYPCLKPIAKKIRSEYTDTYSIEVITTNNKDGRVYDKKHYCLFCEKPQSKLPRHLETAHGEEVEVAQFLIEKDPTQRKQRIKKLRNMGNHLHNTKVMVEGSGNLIVSYRPEFGTSWKDYVPCEYCLGYYVGRDLWKHTRRCELAPVQGKHRRVLQNARLLLPTPESTSGFNEIISSLRNDTIGMACKGDSLIKKLGEKLYLKQGHDKEQLVYIRNSMRELGRLLLQMRKTIGPADANLECFIDPKHFRKVLTCAKEVSGFDPETHLFETPSLALKLGGTLKKCAKILKRDSIITSDTDAKQRANDFAELCQMEWTDEMATHALRTLSENQRNKVKLLPLTKDVMILSQYIRKVGEEACTNLSHTFSPEAWEMLNEVALVSLILFNRRRQGEVSKMKLADLREQHKTSQPDVLDGLSPLEQHLCSVLKRVEIIGKRGRIVPIIITSEMSIWIDILVEKRIDAGVHDGNKFLFARRNYGSLGHIRGCDVLRSFSERCGAKRPLCLRSTKLRKQIGTLSQILNLKENELDILANFLGHDIRVHRQYYRLPEETIQVAKVSKILLSLEKGQLSKQKGKSLDEIEVDVDEEIDLGPEQCDPDEDDDDDASDGDLDTDEDAAVRDLIETKNSLSVPKRKCTKRPWTEIEKEAVKKYFHRNIVMQKLPGKGR